MNEMINGKIALNTREACACLGINRAQLDSYRKQGLIKAIKKGRYYIYPALELKTFVERNTGKQITKEGIVVDS